MVQGALNIKIAKANADVKRLCEFLVARRNWQLAAEAQPAADELRAAAEAVAERIALHLGDAASRPAAPLMSEVVSAGPGSHDGSRLRRFAAFLRDLDAWFAAQQRLPSDPGTVSLLSETRSLMSCITALFSGHTTRPAPADAKPHPAAAQAGSPRQLVLDNTEERPLIEEIENITRLTPACEKLADDFLTAWGIEPSYYRRKKFLEKLLRWINSAPEGQVLVIKMKTIEEPYEPYPSYISRELLSAREQPHND